MKKFVFFLFVSSLLFIGNCNGGQSKIDETVDMTPRLITTSQTLSSTEIADTVKSAIVGISASISNGTSIGSGVAIADGGYVLTNYHVINGGRNFVLYFADGTTAGAKYIWGDGNIDIAILKSDKNMPYLDTCPLSEVNIGDDVLAVGTPLSLQFQHTFTKGIVSALNRTIEISSLGGYVTYMQNLIQHDASINSGNSGGPLINSQGKVIGINSLKASDAEGIGFAIPIETATAVASRVIPNNDFKEVHLGIFGCDAELAKYKNLTTISKGVYVVDLEKDSILYNTDLGIGDVITKINGQVVNNMIDFRKIIYSLNDGDNIDIEFTQGEVQKITKVII